MTLEGHLPAGFALRQAVVEDAPAIARFMLGASRGHLKVGLWDAVLPLDDAAKLSAITRLCREAVCASCSWRTFLVAEVNGVPVAGMNRRPWAANEPGLAVALLRMAREAGWSDERVREMRAGAAVFARCAKWDIPEGACMVDWCFTEPELRGKGIADAMYAPIEAEAMALGRGPCFSAFIGNRPMFKFGLRHGFRVLAEARDPGFERVTGSPGAVLMAKFGAERSGFGH